MTRDLIDRSALLRHRARIGAETGGIGAPFLHEFAADEVSERLTEVNRLFTKIAIVTGFPAFWKQRIPNADIVSDKETIELKTGAYDLVIHALSLHWASDSVGQMIQCRRALRPDGMFLAVLFGGRSLRELRTALAEAESTVSHGISPRVLPMGELRDLGGLLMRAGFALPVADSSVIPVTYASLPDLMQDLRQMGETNALSDRVRTFTPRALMQKAAEVYAHHFSDASGRLIATAELIFLTGWAPDPSQQQPLRPGSATARLADALNTAEFDAGESAGYPRSSDKGQNNNGR